jgi:transglutaminase-like putative cysteine protease
MVAEAIGWMWRRWRPREGWLTLALLAGMVGCLVGAALAAEWTAEVGVVAITAVIALPLALLLAKRPIKPPAAWLLLTLYGLLVTTVYLAELLPPWAVLADGWWAVGAYWRQQGALFLDRMGGWVAAVGNGRSTQETIALSAGLGLAAWFLTAFATWAIFRQRQPLPALSLMGLALALNNYFGGVEVWWLAIFVGLATFTIILVHFIAQEETWQANGLDYSDEIRLELLLLGGGLALCLVMLAAVLPEMRFTRLAAAFQSQPAVLVLEERLERMFAGVTAGRSGVPRPDSPGEPGVMPRSFLLGDPPELRQRLLFTATVVVIGPDGQIIPTDAEALQGVHWRGLSYATYTGRGWTLGAERETLLAAGETIPLPPAAGQSTVQQTIAWQGSPRLVRYVIGLPLRFDHETTAVWQGSNDLIRVEGMAGRYEAISHLTTAGPAALQEALLADVLSVTLARYTQLPDSLPERVPALAQQIAGELGSPYEQARALEQFLRQYPYSLDVPLPPPEADPVDYFLFDLQRGYCDYYASAMVVLARSLGLPARLAIGFLAQPPDEAGVQRIRQADSHSWAEVYFAGYGWVAFEPTAAFASPHEVEERPFSHTNPITPEIVPLPAREVAEGERPFSPVWWAIGLALAGLAASLLWLWGRRPTGERDEVVWVYGRLQQQADKLGQTQSPSQTPTEFAAAFAGRLAYFRRWPRLIPLVDGVQAGVARLAELFNRRRFAPRTEEGDGDGETAVATWRYLRRPLWLFRLLKKFMK